MALKRDYTIERGIQFRRTVTITSGSTPLNLTGATIAGKIRVAKTLFGTGAVVASFTLAVAADPTIGVFTFSLPIPDTLLLAAGESYDYDLVITFPSLDKRRLLMGILTAIEITTHDDPV
jgi:hypothetical protein